VENEREHRLSSNDPIVIDLLQRVARLESRVDSLERTLQSLDKKIDSVEESIKEVDSKTWYIVAGILVTIAIDLLLIMLR